MAQEMGSQKHKGQMQNGQSMKLGALSLKVRCETNTIIRLQEFIRRKTPQLLPDKRILHHENALVHNALRVSESLAKNSITKTDQLPSSPDLDPFEFCYAMYSFLDLHKKLF
jgi:hypothetical protein